MSAPLVESGSDEFDAESCIALWVAAVINRDALSADPTDQDLIAERKGVEARVRAKFAAERVAFVVARAGAPEPVDPGHINGFALVLPPGASLGRVVDPANAAVLSLLAVRADVHGQGIGRALLDAAIVESRGAGCKRLVLHVLTSNSRAIDLYERNGWTKRGAPIALPPRGRSAQTYELTLT